MFALLTSLSRLVILLTIVRKAGADEEVFIAIVLFRCAEMLVHPQNHHQQHVHGAFAEPVSRNWQVWRDGTGWYWLPAHLAAAAYHRSKSAVQVLALLDV
jgi:hypothetical protein